MEKKFKPLIIDKLRCNINYSLREFKEKPVLENKIFCLGLNKTGTTTLKTLFESSNVKVGDQRRAEYLAARYLKTRNINIFKEYIEGSDFFQDIPFSFPWFYRELYKLYPNAKYILSIRDSAEQWASSLMKFHSKRFFHGASPTRELLKRVRYIERDFAYQCMTTMYGEPIYDSANLCKNYENYNKNVQSFFELNPNFIVINVAHEESISRLRRFCDVDFSLEDMPWINRTNG